MRVPAVSTLALVLSCAAPPAAAQLFKWVDEGGVVNYGDWPPSGVKVLPVTHGTVTVIAGVPRQQMEEMRGRDQQRKAQRVRRDADEAATAPAVLATAPTDDIPYGDAYAADYGYPPRRVRPLEPNDRPRPEQPIAKPMVPIDLPAIPDAPLRPRR